MQNEAVTRLFEGLGKALRPPEQVSYSEWAERNFRLSPDATASPGRFRPWKFQRGILDAIGDEKIERVTVVKAARVGYALSLDTPLPTPTGWTTMGDVQEGDLLFDEAGKQCSVTFKSEVFTDHDCYKIVFDAGEEIVADKDHRWFVEADRSFEHMFEGRFVRGDGKRGTNSGVITTEQIFEKWKIGKRTNFAVPLGGKLDLDEKRLPIPPYTLGLWLGDGYSASPYILQHVTDIETADYIRREGVECTVQAKDKRYLNNRTIVLGLLPSGQTFAQAMKETGIRCVEKQSSTKKFIPDIYFRASEDQRLELLRGLMDSDGTIDKRGLAEFCCTSKQLSEGVAEIARSLGYKVFFSERPMSGLMKYPQFRVRFYPNTGTNPFHLRRKFDRVRNTSKPTIAGRHRIVNVVKVEPVNTQCISVDSPSRLFLSGRHMVPTHNTLSLSASIGAIAINDPGPIILVVPTDDDARGIVVDDIDPHFRATPVLKEVMQIGRFDGRNTLTKRSLKGGGTLKILSAAAPRNLRRHTARFIFCDEVDGMEITKEGDPVKLAEMRSLSFANRKIVIGSTPVDENTSLIIKRYNESDQRIFELPCPHCSDRFELQWENLDWVAGKPQTVVAICPSCGCAIEEKHKPEMVENGEWRATAPHREGHAGFRLSALISQFANAAWPKLVDEYELAKKAGSADLQVFYNTTLGRGWSTAVDYVSETELMGRVENFGIMWDNDAGQWRQDIPEEVAFITAGVDVQYDRIEITFVGHSEGHIWFLGHHKVFGDTRLSTVWDDVYAVLSTCWKHPLGGEIGVEAAGVDSGDGNMTQTVYEFCEMHQGAKIFAIKGREGNIRELDISGSRRNYRAPLYIVGADTVKTFIVTGLPKEPGEIGSFRFSNSLTADWFEQFASEKRVQVYKNGRPVVRFEGVGKRRHEAIDCAVYGIAIRKAVRFDYPARYEELKATGPVEQKKSTARDLAAKLNRF